MRPSGRLRGALVAAAMVVLSAAAVPLLLEAGMRFAHPLLPRDLKIVWIRSRLMRQLQLPHPQLLWAPYPSLTLHYDAGGFRWRLQHVPYPGDGRFGYRADAPPRAPVDLAVIGDSYTYGFEVDQDATWVERLRRSTGANVVNLAVTSYGTSQEATLYRLYGRAFKPRSVVQIIATNDPQDNVFFNTIDARKDVRMTNLCWFLGVGQPSAACSAALWLARNSVVGGLAVFELQALAKRWSPTDPNLAPGTEMICDDVRAMRAATRADGAKYSAVLIGYWLGPRMKPYRERLVSCLKDAGVPYFQLDEQVEARRRGRRFFGRFDLHWNEEGHEYVARRIEAFLREKKLL